MGDEKLLAKLSEGDMISREKSYHGKCMTRFNNMYRKFVNRKTNPENDRRQGVENIALAQVMEYIEESLQTSDSVAPFVKLSDLKKVYFEVLENVDDIITYVNSTRLKERIIELNNNLEASSHKKEVFISYKDDLGAALKYSEENDASHSLNHLIKAAKCIRKEIVSIQNDFTGGFSRKLSKKFRFTISFAFT